MERIASWLWIVPALPLLAAAAIAPMRGHRRRAAAALAIGAMALAFAGACAAFAATWFPPAGSGSFQAHADAAWFVVGGVPFRVGCLLDPLSASMLVMVTFVATLVLVFGTAYMADDPNAGRFFGFLSLFAAAMLGLVVSNNLLVLFMCWELVGVASYLLIGFWYRKPEAAAAARKAFVVTRVGDLGFLLGIAWLNHASGTLLFYDGGAGCLEQDALTRLAAQATVGGMAVSTAISLLLFCGAAGKSGQVPLHVWLPDAMEGPTPVSALIHAATMVAAGVFLMARVFPLLSATVAGPAGGEGFAATTALSAITWVGAVTAFFGALVAVAQNDIKRILAYSTVSQLGYMMVGIGTGGPAVGMMHLLAHAFFKALLFLGAGSVIHGCGGEQDIRRLGGLRRRMRVTFAAYAVGMMALSGVPVAFSGFWTKDEVLHAAFHWGPSRLPFALGLLGAALTAFYMTRQVWFVFLADARTPETRQPDGHDDVHGHGHSHAGPAHAHEGPRAMTVPLVVLAAATVFLVGVATPAWPWLHAYLAGHLDHLRAGWDADASAVAIMALSTGAAGLGIGLALFLYPRAPRGTEPVALAWPRVHRALERRLYADEILGATVVRLARWASVAADGADRYVWGGFVLVAKAATAVAALVGRVFDDGAVNPGFDAGCSAARGLGRIASRLQDGRTQRYLKILAAAVVALVAALAWIGNP